MWTPTWQEIRYLQAVGLVSVLCLVLFVVRILLTGDLQFLFIPGNLLLAWLALITSWILVRYLRLHRWLSWQNLGLTFIWLSFLPNTWYVLTDFIHVEPSGSISELYDIVLISILVLSGFTLGFTSLYLVHKELLKRLGERNSNWLVGFLILVASFSIYLGRHLRWNTWDVITNPSGIILNVSDRILDPLGHPRALNVTALFFILLCPTYFAFWLLVRPNSPIKKR